MKKLVLLMMPLMVALLAACSAMDQLDSAVEEINENCPQHIEMGLTLTKACRTNTELVYMYTVDESVLGEDIIQNIHLTEDLIRHEMKSTIMRDSEMRELAKVLAEHNMSLVQEYKGSISGKTARIVITASDLRAL